jgi:peptide/nickel transport system substrate-binding protein
MRGLILRLTAASLIEKVLFAAILFLTLVGFLLVIERASNAFAVRIPIEGGILQEGVVGFPTNVNPIFASSNADHDLVALVYSGLMRVGGAGELALGLAQSYSISEDRKEYTFTLRDDIFFHDGTPITARDVVFTIETIQNPAMGSVLFNSFNGVTVAEQDFRTVVFTLDEPYVGFLATLTVGIVPKHIWQNVQLGSLAFIELSSFPIGSGPFRVVGVERSESLGVPVRYSLVAFERYGGGRAHIDAIEFHFYPSEEDLISALWRREVQSAPFVSPTALGGSDREKNIMNAPMLRVFGIYFNQDEAPILANRSIRSVINGAIDRTSLVENIFSRYAVPTTVPFLSLQESNPEQVDKEALLEMLQEAGWEETTEGGVREKDGERLAFTIRTVNSDDLIRTAEFIQRALRPLGFDVKVETFDVNSLNQNVIRQRDYEALLFGQAYGRFIDFYPFWHSSNRNDPGLNIARYVSSGMDKVLVALRREADPRERARLTRAFVEELEREVPAVFLYVPRFTYVTDARTHNIRIPSIERSSDRFANVEDWFVYTDTVWRFFIQQ